MKKSDLFPHMPSIPSEPWNKNDNIIWLASTVKVLRNIEKFKFPNRLESEKKQQLLELMLRSLAACSQITLSQELKAEELLPLEKDFLSEHFLLSESIQEARKAEAFVIGNSGAFIALLNVKDHIQLQYTDCSGNLEKTWEKLVQTENEFSKTLSFAFSNKFGFLTQDPHYCGTGLVISAYLHLPALIHLNLLQDALEKEHSEAVLATGLQGNPDDLIGDILLLKNSCTLGINEETIVSTLRNSILRLVVAEKHARGIIKTEQSAHIKDIISRAIGTLKFSYQLDTMEALQALSLVKLGGEIGYIAGMNTSEINCLFFNMRRAHICTLINERIPHEELSSRRAAYLREKTAHLQINFH